MLKPAVISLAAVGLAGCATSMNPSPAEYTAADTTFVGWLRFSGEEFQLNADQDQVLQPLGARR